MHLYDLLHPEDMNLDVLRTWVAALRSDEYEQTEGVLTRVSTTGAKGHCCLGVLTELAVEAEVIPAGLPSGGVLGYGEYREQHGLPQEVMDWAGIRLDHLPVRHPNNDDEVISVIAMNDGGHFTFNDIADAIEATYLTPASV